MSSCSVTCSDAGGNQYSDCDCILSGFCPAQNMEDLTEQYTNIIGDVLISAAVVAYLGPFILDFRQVS